MEIIYLYDFQIAQTKEFEKNIEKLDPKIYIKIKNIKFKGVRYGGFFYNFKKKHRF